jgi:hypothetical protein
VGKITPYAIKTSNVEFSPTAASSGMKTSMKCLHPRDYEAVTVTIPHLKSFVNQKTPIFDTELLFLSLLYPIFYPQKPPFSSRIKHRDTLPALTHILIYSFSKKILKFFDIH